jgi:hypothetical protein
VQKAERASKKSQKEGEEKAAINPQAKAAEPRSAAAICQELAFGVQGQGLWEELRPDGMV